MFPSALAEKELAPVCCLFERNRITTAIKKAIVVRVFFFIFIFIYLFTFFVYVIKMERHMPF